MRYGYPRIPRLLKRGLASVQKTDRGVYKELGLQLRNKTTAGGSPARRGCRPPRSAGACDAPSSAGPGIWSLRLRRSSATRGTTPANCFTSTSRSWGGPPGSAPGHRTIDSKSRGAGWEYVHVCVVNAACLPFASIRRSERRQRRGLPDGRRRRLRGLGLHVRAGITDNGACYLSRAVQDLSGSGLRHIRTRLYTPRTSGKAGCFIQAAHSRMGIKGPTPAAGLTGPHPEPDQQITISEGNPVKTTPASGQAPL